MSTILHTLQHFRSQGRKALAILLDPDKIDREGAKQLAFRADEAGVDFFFLGGSLVLENRIEELIEGIREACEIPVVLFPGSAIQIHPAADALLFLSLISGRNAEMLIGKQVEAAAMVRASGLEVMPTGYMLIDGGRLTTAHYMSGTLPIPFDKAEVAVSTAIAGELLGLQVLYMDAGSGAKIPVQPAMVEAVRKSVELPLIVGGGIRDKDAALATLNAGADLIVVGTAVEEQGENLLPQLTQAVREVSASQPIH